MLRDTHPPPLSPIATYMPSHSSPPGPSYSDTLSDIFGSAPPSPSNPHHPNLTSLIPEHSDIRSLHSEHFTAGYRDGLGVGKAETLQTGFDEGYSLGAVIGLRVGNIRGILEGIERAVRRSGGSVDGKRERERARMAGLVGMAREELRTEKVFGREFWGEDGIWLFSVGDGDDDTAGAGGEVLFPDVADAHPLLRKWEGVIKEEGERWSLDLRVMERDEVTRMGDEHEIGVKS